MTYSKDSPEDRWLHRTYHDEIVNEVPARQLKSDKEIWRLGENSIIVVNALSPKAQRNLATKVGSAANKEMHYDFGVYDADERPDDREIHLFVFRSGDRATGLAILEKHTGVCHYTWGEYDQRLQKKFKEQEPIWSLVFIWALKKYRRRRIAQILLVEAVGYLGVRINDIGLYTPFSDDGEAFLRSIFPEGFLIAK